MAYAHVAGGGLHTTYAEAPVVEVVTHREAMPDLSLVFRSAPTTEDVSAAFTKVVFRQILEYHWVNYLLDLELGNQGDLAFRLIEISDSDRLRRLVEAGILGCANLSDRLDEKFNESDVRHYRICFDDHGTYEVICTEVSISQFSTIDEAVNGQRGY